MQTVLLVIHLMVVIALVGVVLIQRSEGGALGIGGGGGFMTSRGTANVLTRTTAILAAVFFLTSLALTILPRVLGTGGSILDTVPGVAPAAPTSPNAPIGTGQGGVLDLLKKNTPAGAGETAPAGAVQTPPAATPATPAPAATTPAAPAPAATAPAAPAPAATAPAPAAPATTAPAATAPAPQTTAPAATTPAPAATTPPATPAAPAQ